MIDWAACRPVPQSDGVGGPSTEDDVRFSEFLHNADISRCLRVTRGRNIDGACGRLQRRTYNRHYYYFNSPKGPVLSLPIRMNRHNILRLLLQIFDNAVKGRATPSGDWSHSSCLDIRYGTVVESTVHSNLLIRDPVESPRTTTAGRGQ